MRTKTALLALVTIAASALPLGAAQAQAASQSLEGEFANRKRELQTLERDLKTREEKLTKDGATMAEAERRNQEKSLRDSQRDFARKQNEFMEDLNVRRNEALGQLQRTVLQEVQTYAKTAGLDLVVADALYASPSVDITQQVLSALQAKGKAAPPAKP